MLEGACSRPEPRPASPTKGSKDSPVPALTPPSPTVATPATGNAGNTEAPNGESSNGPTPTPPFTPTGDAEIPIVENSGRTDDQAKTGEDGPSGGPRGIDGLNNGCYMNSVLQIIAALYADKVQGSPLKEIVQKINNSEGEAVKQADVQAFVDRLPEGEAKNMASSDNQEDTSEFINRLNGNYKFLETYDSSIQLFIKDSDGKTRSKTRLKEQNDMLLVGFSTNTDKLGEMIALPNNGELVESVFNYDKNEFRDVSNLPNFVLNNNDKLHPVNGSLQAPNHVRQTVITNLPNTLCVCLNRFNGEQQKTTTKVTRTEEITIDSEGKGVKYTLSGFTVHGGEGIKGGHHVAYVKKGNTWYYTSDTTVKTVNDAIEASQDAYLLFYTKG
ncbi:ubiquitin carboxyl-terminal hydrolase family protein [Cardinium endosymbiont of Tipula unca]|uniref:ubiquitin carboxyl-terminal hydrolase family protein n=1 Tax=Cardinium endosymbiont of Tipula unca TaxID=3066216 RepID=UPI0030CFF3C3